MNISEARKEICDFLNNVTQVEEFAQKLKLEQKDGIWTPSAKPASNDIQQRAKAFGESLIPYLETYGKEMIRQFFDYWTEPNKSKTKLRWEIEQTWDLQRRLKRWHAAKLQKSASTAPVDKIRERI